jgi:SNF2 family DNA or RNA helicase
LDEFFAMVDFTNPGVLGDSASFRKRFEAPILTAREVSASRLLVVAKSFGWEPVRDDTAQHESKGVTA